MRILILVIIGGNKKWKKHLIINEILFNISCIIASGVISIIHHNGDQKIGIGKKLNCNSNLFYFSTENLTTVMAFSIM